MVRYVAVFAHKQTWLLAMQSIVSATMTTFRFEIAFSCPRIEERERERVELATVFDVGQIHLIKYYTMPVVTSDCKAGGVVHIGPLSTKWHSTR